MPASTGSEVLQLALRLWPQVRDHGVVDDPGDLDQLIAAQGGAGRPRLRMRSAPHLLVLFRRTRRRGSRSPPASSPDSDDSARFIAHLLVTRTLLAAGLSIDERVDRAMCEAYALSPGAPAAEATTTRRR